MTVCIAAIYGRSTILGASDRMVTGGYGDITFEPKTSKILTLSNSIAVLTAGDQSIQFRVFQQANKIIGVKIDTDRSKWIELAEAAEVYSKCYYELRKKLIENQVLTTFGLSYDTYIDKLKNAGSDLLIRLINEKVDRFIRYFETNQRIETIIAGIDDFGPHIYVVNNGEVSYHDKVGFASIGIGSNVANAHFMATAYSPSESESKALLTIHQAKKKAEVSPGVGKATDMCIIGPAKGSFRMIEKPLFPRNIIKDLDIFYTKYKKAIRSEDSRAEKEIRKYLKHLGPSVSPAQEVKPLSISSSKSVTVTEPILPPQNKVGEELKRGN